MLQNSNRKRGLSRSGNSGIIDPKDVEAKGGISHKMGLLFSKQNDYEKSIQYQKQYLEISSLHSNPVFLIFCVNGRRPRRSRWRPTRRSPRPT